MYQSQKDPLRVCITIHFVITKCTEITPILYSKYVNNATQIESFKGVICLPFKNLLQVLFNLVSH